MVSVWPGVQTGLLVDNRGETSHWLLDRLVTLGFAVWPQHDILVVDLCSVICLRVSICMAVFMPWYCFTTMQTVGY